MEVTLFLPSFVYHALAFISLSRCACLLCCRARAQGINAVRNLRFENVDRAARLGVDNCGAFCGTTHATMSAKIYSVINLDPLYLGRHCFPHVNIRGCVT